MEKNFIVGFALCVDKDYHSIECTTDLTKGERKTNVYMLKCDEKPSYVPHYKVKKTAQSEPTYTIANDKL